MKNLSRSGVQKMDKKKIFITTSTILAIVSLVAITTAVITIYKDFTTFSSPELYVSESFVKDIKIDGDKAVVTYSLSFHNTDDDGIGDVRLAAYFGDETVLSQETVDIHAYEIVQNMDFTFKIPMSIYNENQSLPDFAVHYSDDYVNFTKVTGRILE